MIAFGTLRERLNASPLQENSFGQKLIIGRPNADASSTLRERPYRSQEVEFL
ncbi:hypothetical protein [Sphaerospermopsis sp. FACHB-1194]|uniref:hypothetical protein n=1 Tax=Sphaerospermopsis sp. FACHB-1194 TaxID=2692862 RepID=UPI0016805A52|nr:hypothetical protein [Sphaerospermopsis sp. FACHB-1194]MBD2145903.1 hypothetical protein [Sphaerospermopsis sp. FACHB-1194]